MDKVVQVAEKEVITVFVISTNSASCRRLCVLCDPCFTCKMSSVMTTLFTGADWVGMPVLPFIDGLR